MSLLRKLIYTCSILIVCAIAFAFASCRVALPVPTTTTQPRVVVVEPERPRPTTSTRTKTTKRSGGGRCEGDDDCEEMCEDLFSSRSKREDCEELSEDDVENMFVAFEEDDGYLAEPDEDDLEDIHADAVENALDIDERVWTDLFRKYSKTEARRVLYWIATNKEIYDAIDSSLDDDDLEDFFKELIDEFISNSKFWKFITEEIEDDEEDNFINLAYDDDSDAASFIIERASEDCDEPSGGNIALITEKDHQKPACLLKVICGHKDGNSFIFDDSFEYILDDVGDLQDYIEDGTTTSSGTGFHDGLGVSDRDSDDISDACAAADAQGLF